MQLHLNSYGAYLHVKDAMFDVRKKLENGTVETKTIAAQNNEGTPEALRKFQQSLHDEVMTIIAEQEPFKEPKSK